MEIKDIPAGESWACKFRTTTFLDAQGQPVAAQNLQLGQAHPGSPGVYESLGIICTRDLESARVELQDTQSTQRFIVDFDNCWALDTIEWIE